MTDKLLSCRNKRPEAKVRLICFAWSGAGASVFNTWAKLLPAEIERKVVGVTLAGRETRYKQQCDYSARNVADHIATAIHNSYRDKPIFIFGHSLGALLCQEVVATLRADYGMVPAHVYLSGESPPQSAFPERRPKKNYRDMDDSELKKAVICLQCLPFNILTNDEMLKLYLPALRADLTLVDQLIYDIPCRLRQEPLSCPLTVFKAMEDDPFDTEGWKALTSGPFAVKQFVGAHLYLKDPDNEKRISDLISADVKAFLNSD